MNELNKPGIIFIKSDNTVYLIFMILVCIILSGCVVKNDASLEQQSPVISTVEREVTEKVLSQDSDAIQQTTLAYTLADVVTQTPGSSPMSVPTFSQVGTVSTILEQPLVPTSKLTSTPTPRQSTNPFLPTESTQQVFAPSAELDVPAEEESQYLPLVIQQDVPTPTSATKQPELVFSDEFNGTSLDQNKWETRFPWGGTIETNNELECYSPKFVSVKDGILRLRAVEKTITCMGIYSQISGLPYSSGMVASHSHFSFQYGFAEIRAKVPAGVGLWPTFWLLPEVEAPNTIDWPPEIDVMEILGNEPTKVYLGNWGGTEFDASHYAGDYRGPDFSADFHVFGLSWEPDLLIWYVDGVERFRSDQEVPAVPMYLIANLAVGGNWPGSPNEDTEFPSTFEVDYIRVYDVGF